MIFSHTRPVVPFCTYNGGYGNGQRRRLLVRQVVRDLDLQIALDEDILPKGAILVPESITE